MPKTVIMASYILAVSLLGVFLGNQFVIIWIAWARVMVKIVTEETNMNMRQMLKRVAAANMATSHVARRMRSINGLVKCLAGVHRRCSWQELR